MSELLGNLGFMELLVAAAATSIVVGAITIVKLSENPIFKKAVLPIVALLITLLRTEYTSLQDTLYELLITWSFAMLFYSYVGKWFINKVFTSIKNRLSDETK